MVIQVRIFVRIYDMRKISEDSEYIGMRGEKKKKFIVHEDLKICTMRCRVTEQVS
jgi:hypothetical protein